MDAQTKICQNCKNSFTIEPDDFGFYEQMKVPAPTWCPQCRLLRRMNWFGCRILYKRKCDATGENIITFYHPDLPVKVYKQDVWWGDSWDPLSYGRDYDFSRPFFVQYKELMDAVPKAALCTEYSTIVNSPYINAGTGLKNCYLSFKGVTAEDCAYTHFTFQTKNCLDIAYSRDDELCYEVVNTRGSYQAFYSQDCEDCSDVYFSRDLVGCSNCFGCTNLRQKQYYWFNEQLTRDEYQKRFKEVDLGVSRNVARMKRQAYEQSLQHPRRAFHGRNNVDASGEYLYNDKNVRDSYFVADSEDLRYCSHFSKGGVKHSYDFTYFGSLSEWIYDSTWLGHNNNNVKFGIWNYRNTETEYTFSCHGSAHLFGCAGMKKGEYCILNKQYSKEDYFAMVEKIKKHMAEMPYKDAMGRQYRYGEHLPAELSYWAYNESNAIEFFPLTKEEAIKQGFKWRDEDKREYQNASVVISDNIKDATDDILKGILKCDDCGKNYQIIPMELQFLRRFNLPIPRQCPLCRDRARIKQLSPMKIYDRTCAKCQKAIQTSYSPDRSEIVYCEQCYQAEVV